MKRDYYQVLNVGRDASSEEIKKTFRKIALECHPDRRPGDHEAEERFKEAQEAYAILSNPESRQRYDRHGFEGLRGQPGFEDFGGHPFESLFQDIFDEFFGARGGRPGRPDSRGQRGEDLLYSIRISFAEAYQGTEKEIKLARNSTCPECRGNRAQAGSGEKTCSKCRGRGEVYLRQGFITVAQTCRQCRGRGRIVDEPCTHCRGSGRVPGEKKLTVKIPPGVDTGMRLRVEKEGEGGIEGGEAGDLYLQLEVESHPLFKREGANLHLEIPLSFSQAAVGIDLEVPTPEGQEKVKIKPGVQTGDNLNLKGRGMPSLNGYERGNLYLHLMVETPTGLTKRQKELLAEFDQIVAEKGSGSKVQRFWEMVREVFQ